MCKPWSRTEDVTQVFLVDERYGCGTQEEGRRHDIHCVDCANNFNENGVVCKDSFPHLYHLSPG